MKQQSAYISCKILVIFLGQSAFRASQSKWVRPSIPKLAIPASSRLFFLQMIPQQPMAAPSAFAEDRNHC